MVINVKSITPLIQCDRLTRPEAAEYLGVTPQTLANWAHTGKVKIPHHKIGRKVIYFRSDLDTFLLSVRRVQTA
ncbi:helix-turn-helix domain-containing protein [Klebsiella quasipneumoniae]|uniref:helix-turn-helix domain-containing protein n=1 Tax=Klebsiella pneumoniae complex TaxID=3390273 RepID=UPI0025A16134|nr:MULTISPECIES: helix-turn-helix domain-containing protein [Klebsiella]MDM7174591.1 helix-turn-helix domain-containing protein [Klebsiella variicola]MDR4547363.1 helix-turn-helix domain-containing protein [Klebsiella quasipneumoniae]WRP38257.1 helix-turn-helix domain-containing protein [Klebsiella variicola]